MFRFNRIKDLILLNKTVDNNNSVLKYFLHKMPSKSVSVKEIVIYHNHEQVDKDAITVCDEIKWSDDHKKLDNEIIQVWESLEKKPKVIVFDLDLTLWPFWVCTHASPPFKKISNPSNETFSIIDSNNKKLTFYSEVPNILNTLRYCASKSNSRMAVASRTPTYEAAKQLLELYEWLNHFECLQMFTDTKVKHIKNISEELSVVDKNDILFFDDEEKNIKETSPLGITAILLNTMHGKRFFQVIYLKY